MSDKPLSPTMEFARAYAVNNGGCLVRYPGGFWARDAWPQGERPYFGTTTVEALVTRGVLHYTEYKETARGKFPIRAEVV